MAEKLQYKLEDIWLMKLSVFAPSIYCPSNTNQKLKDFGSISCYNKFKAK